MIEETEKANPNIKYFSDEQYYSANLDFADSRIVHDGHEMVDYQTGSQHRIWMNDQAENYAPHWHSALEIIVPIENIYTCICSDTRYVVEPAQILFIPPGLVHELIAPPTGRRFVFMMNISAVSRLRSFARIMSIFSQPLWLKEDENASVYSEIYNLLLQIRNEYFGVNEFADLSILSLLLKMFVCIGEHYDQQENIFGDITPSKRREYIDLFNSTLKYIDEHFSEELTLGTIAARTGFSKFHFSRLFKQYTNYNFSDYLCFRRIREAETLLMRPGISITDVAISSGFSSISTFNRLFKQQKGCSPSEYRRRCAASSQKKQS